MFSKLDVEETAPRSKYHGLRPSLEAVLMIFMSYKDGLGMVGLSSGGLHTCGRYETTTPNISDDASINWAVTMGG